MAERWQQWMPFHIDKWRGSPSVQAMHPAAQMGYLNMLCSCWQSVDCCLPDDAIDLATESRLGDELWALYGPRILRKFVLIAGRWRNEVLFREWERMRRGRVVGRRINPSKGRRPHPHVWREIRQRVFVRDRFTCLYCGAKGGRLECDHVVPVSRGGSSDDDNLATACFACNRSKRAMLVEEWVKANAQV